MGQGKFLRVNGKKIRKNYTIQYNALAMWYLIPATINVQQTDFVGLLQF